MPAEWSHGYVTEIPYTSGFYKEMTPTWLWFVANLLNQSFDLEPGYCYCELGCGTGFGLNVMAASNPDGIFYGVDINPSHIRIARELAERTGLKNVHFIEGDFVQLGKNPPQDWPEFDIIALHGILSWVGKEVRKGIVSFAKAKLKPGGLVYASYNAMPGWALTHPLRRLFWEYAKVIPGTIDAKARKGLDFARKLKNAGIPFFRTYPPIAKKIEKISSQNINYFIHEYLNDEWHPFYFTDILDEFAEGKFFYLGSATIADNMDNLLPAELRNLLEEIPDPIVREAIKDICVNKGFRKDIFVKGRVPRLPFERLNILRNRVKLLLTVSPDQVKWTFQTYVGEAKGDEAIYKPLFELLKEGPKTINELSNSQALENRPPVVAIQASSMMVHSDQAHPFRMPDPPEKVEKTALEFNRYVSTRVLNGAPWNFLAAPQIGSGIPVSFVDMSILALINPYSNPKAPPNLHEQIWNRMKTLGRRMMKDGKPVESEEENIKAVKEAVQEFFDQKLHLWKSMGIIP